MVFTHGSALVVCGLFVRFIVPMVLVDEVLKLPDFVFQVSRFNLDVYAVVTIGM